MKQFPSRAARRAATARSARPVVLGHARLGASVCTASGLVVNGQLRHMRGHATLQGHITDTDRQVYRAPFKA